MSVPASAAPQIVAQPPLPGHPFVAYRNGSLHLEDAALVALAQAHGTPLFVYSKAAMLAALGAYQRGFAGRQAQICYAMKANSTLGVLQVFAAAGCGFTVSAECGPQGSVRTKRVGSPATLAWRTSPPCSWASRQAVGNPRPRPRPACRPEKNGSNKCSA